MRAKLTVACPKCGSISRSYRGNVRNLDKPTDSYDRVRICMSCGHKFHTLEIWATSIKENRRSVPQVVPGQVYDNCARCELTKRFTNQIGESISRWNSE